MYSACLQPQTHSTISKNSLDQAALVFSTVRQIFANIDVETREHCIRLANQARAFGEFLDLPSADVHTLVWGAYLHDVGKIGIPTDILFKPDQLSSDEWEIMKQHVLIGEYLCASRFPMHQVIPIIRHHHERWNGTGYPDRLVGDSIPYLARVVQILDVYDALTHPRSYKPTYTHRKALEIIAEETANGWYEPELVEQFLDFIGIECGV